MDSAIKQRLLGAAVLIALAVIFVPMFLSNSPPKQDNTTLNLDIPPPPERKFETRTLPVDSNTTATPAVVQPVPTDAVVTVDTNAPPQMDARPEDAPVPTPETSAPAEKSVSVVTKPLAQSKVGPAQSETPAAASTAMPGRFSVHLGVYTDQAHADALAANIKKLNLPAYVEATNYQGKPAQRVRVGPFADRAAAESARLKIKQAEPRVPSSVVESAEQPVADAPREALSANRAGGWAVQLGAFKSEDEANKLRDRVRAAGFTAFVDHVGSNAQMLWRARVGPQAERADADKLRTSLKQTLKLDSIIVVLP